MEDIIILPYPVKNVKNQSTISVILDPSNGSKVREFMKDHLELFTPEDMKKEDIIGVDFVKLSKNEYKYACYIYSTGQWTDEVDVSGDVVKAINSVAKKYSADYIADKTQSVGDKLRGKKVKPSDYGTDYAEEFGKNFRKMI